MSRPVHIAALDAALDESMTRLAAAEAAYQRELSTHIRALSAVDQASKARADAYYDAQHCEDAIRRLGFCVLGDGDRIVGKNASRLDGHQLRPADDKEHALWRAGLPGGREPDPIDREENPS